jgi:nucleotide-binding universal stress UspA family protein
MPATRQLLVGFDGSPPARIALRRAAHIARHDNACLTILLALDVPRLAAASVLTGTALPLELLERDASDELRRAVAELPADISVASLAVHGAAGPALAREAKRLCADAIVIGSRRGICTRLTGGVARYLRRHAPAQVIVVKPPPARRRRARDTARTFNLRFLGRKSSSSTTPRAGPTTGGTPRHQTPPPTGTLR